MSFGYNTNCKTPTWSNQNTVSVTSVAPTTCAPNTTTCAPTTTTAPILTGTPHPNCTVVPTSTPFVPTITLPTGTNPVPTIVPGLSPTKGGNGNPQPKGITNAPTPTISVTVTPTSTDVGIATNPTPTTVVPVRYPVSNRIVYTPTPTIGITVTLPPTMPAPTEPVGTPIPASDAWDLLDNQKKTWFEFINSTPNPNPIPVDSEMEPIVLDVLLPKDFYSKEELLKAGFTQAQIQIFFVENPEDGCSLNDNLIRKFFGTDVSINFAQQLKDALSSMNMVARQKRTYLENFVTAYVNGNSEWGFDNEKYDLTSEEIKDIISGLCKNKDIKDFNGNFTDFEKLVQSKMKNITGLVELTIFENKKESPEFDINPENKDFYFEQYENLLLNKLITVNNFSEGFANTILGLAKGESYNYYSSIYIFGDYVYQLSEAEISTDIDSLSRVIMRNEAVDDVNNKLFISIFDSIFKEFNLDHIEKNTFISMVFSEIALELGLITNKYEYLNKDLILFDLKRLDKNNNNTWFDELYEIAHSKTADLKHIDYKEIENANTCDLNKLFCGNDVLTANDLINNWCDLSLSSDPGVRKLLNKLYYMFYCFKEEYSRLLNLDSFEAEDYFYSNVIALINNHVNISNTNPPALSIESLNSVNLFEMLHAPHFRENLLEQMIKNSSDGIIENVNQGSTGDCYFLSALLSLCSTPQGQEMVKDAIQWSEDGSYVNVYFAGLDKYIKVTMEEVKEAVKSGEHSQDDIDVLIMELAMENIIGEKDFDNGGSSKEFWNRFLNITDCEEKYSKGVDDALQRVGGWLDWSSGKLDLNSSVISDFLKKLYKASISGEGFAATCSFYAKGDATWSWTDVYGKTHSFSTNSSGHAFAITEITATTVTFANPWDSENMAYTVTWEEFAKMGLYRLAMVTF